MNEPPPALTPDPPAPVAPKMSLAARLLNIFAVPSDVFEEIRTSPHSAANWVVSALLGAIVGAISVVIILSQPAVIQKIREQQDQAIEKRMEKLVQAGKLSRQDVEKQKELAEKISSPAIMKSFGAATAVAMSFARVFFWALVLWLLSRWLLRTRLDYMKLAEVVGLAAMIGILGAVVKLLLQVNFSNPTSSPSLAIFIREMDPRNPLHMLLGVLNLFDFWELAVIALGVAKLAGTSFGRAGFAVIGFWAVWSSILIVVSAGVQRIFG